MIGGDVHNAGSLDALMAEIRRLKNPDLMPLGLDIKAALVEGNREGLKAGLDAAGVPMAPLADSTYERGRGGFGPPTVPRFDGSQLIDRFRVEVEFKDTDGLRVKAAWPGVEQVKYFKSGTRHMPARNPAGIRPATRQKIREIVAAFARKLAIKF